VTYRAVLFDLDGTLLDTLDDLAGAANAVLATLGCPPHDCDAYRYFVGNGTAEMMRRALPEARRDAETVRPAVQRMRRAYAQRIEETTRPYEGVPEMLEALAALAVRMAVLTNKPSASARHLVSRMLSPWRFEVVRGARDGVPLKPDPIAAFQIAAEMGLPPGAFLYLGDSDTDMQTARAAGMFAVGALWGFRTEQELRCAGAQALVRHPTELLDLL